MTVDPKELRGAVALVVKLNQAQIDAANEQYGPKREGFAEFCKATRTLRAFLDSGLTDSEREVRTQLWLGHGHTGVYGDDGEMQCAQCIGDGFRGDYKREPMIECAKAALRARRALTDSERETVGKVREEMGEYYRPGAMNTFPIWDMVRRWNAALAHIAEGKP